MASKVNVGFIIGTGRCGTTWLGQMLNSHAEICVPPEIQMLFEYSDNSSRLFEAFSEEGSSGLKGDRIASIIQQGCPHKLELFFDYHGFCLREDTPKGSLVDFVTAFYSAIAMAHGKSWLIEQTPWYGSRLDLLSLFFPKAKVIHMVRDGRDVALSFARTPWWHTSPRLNLARWQREIKKITLDASLYLDASCYLEVKYEDLVANTENEMRRICEFLGVEYDSTILNSRGFIDYEKFSKFDMQQASSQAYTAWRQRKDSPSFSENIHAWRRTEGLFHPPLPDEIVHWLTRYGYEVALEKPEGLNTDQYHLEYNFNALEPRNLTQTGQIHALEEALQQQVEHTEFVVKDWAARGEQINHLAHTVDTLEKALQQQVEHTELVVKDWAARGEQIDHLAHAVDTLEEALQQQFEHTELVVNNWAARGEQIDQLAHTVDTLMAALQQQVGQTELVAKDWAARGEQVDQLARTVDTLMAALQQQVGYSELVAKDWAARGELIEQLAQTIATLEGNLKEFRASWYRKLRFTISKKK